MSETANDLVLMRYELFPNLDETPREEQRDKIKQLFVGRGLIDDAIELYVSEDTVRDIDKLRFDGLTDYVERVNHRMRHGEIIDLTIPTGTLSAQELFAVIYDQDRQDRPALFTRRIDSSQIPFAKQTGSDRDKTSKLNYHDGFNEAQAIREYAITDSSDVTYISTVFPGDKDLHIDDGTATLVYAVEGLQPLSTYKNNRHGSFGLAAFVDKRLKQPSLLAVLQTTV